MLPEDHEFEVGKTYFDVDGIMYTFTRMSSAIKGRYMFMTQHAEEGSGGFVSLNKQEAKAMLYIDKPPVQDADNITQFPGTQPNPAQASMDAMRELNKSWDDTLEFILTVARIKKASYDAYLEEGFNEQQALELAKAGLGI